MELTKEQLLLELQRKHELIQLLKQEQDRLLKENKQLSNEADSLAEQKKILEALILFLKRKPFLAKSESLSDTQINLFNEAEVEDNLAEDALEDDLESKGDIQKPKKASGGRRKLPDFIEREDVIIDLPESEKICLHDGSLLKKVGEEVSEKIKIIPLQIRVIRTIRYKYSCELCEESNKVSAIPVTLIPKSIATPETLAFIAVSKYEDALPLYRIENILARNEIPITRATLAHWMIQSASACTPLINLMKDDLLNSTYMHMDETTVQVLDEKDRKATLKSYMWVQLSTAEHKKIVLFNYDPSRSGQSAKNLLEGFCGYLQVDGYAGYNFTESKLSKIKRISCLAHVRRKFKFLLDDKTLRTPFVIEVIKLIRKIYDEESRLGYDREVEKEKVIAYKIKFVQPLLEKLKNLVENKNGKIPPRTPLGEAIHYAVNELPLLVENYSEDARIRLDNNLVENAIRPFAVGRKNWLFSQSVAGAESSSTLYSLIESAKLNEINPYKYLLHIFKEIPKCTKIEDFEKLLPFNLKTAMLTGLN